MGLLISASHNDYRYNGYKLSSGNGSQFDPEERDIMYETFIAKSTTADIKLLPLEEAPKGKLFLAGRRRAGPRRRLFRPREHCLINMHKAHIDHMGHFMHAAGDARGDDAKQPKDPHAHRLLRLLRCRTQSRSAPAQREPVSATIKPIHPQRPE